MAWITPVTNRTDGTARMTYTDMERITGNIAYLYDLCQDQGIPIAGSRISKTTWIRNDIITVAQWAEILTCLANARDAVGYPAQDPTDQMTWDNINEVERITAAVYGAIQAYEHMARLNHYVGDMLGSDYRYAGDDFNAGGRYD